MNSFVRPPQRLVGLRPRVASAAGRNGGRLGRNGFDSGYGEGGVSTCMIFFPALPAKPRRLIDRESMDRGRLWVWGVAMSSWLDRVRRRRLKQLPASACSWEGGGSGLGTGNDRRCGYGGGEVGIEGLDGKQDGEGVGRQAGWAVGVTGDFSLLDLLGEVTWHFFFPIRSNSAFL
jgi:hypothetical protein